MEYTFEFAFTHAPEIWVTTSVTTQEAVECLQTGLLRNVSVKKVKLFAVGEDESSHTFIYDIEAAHTGGLAWTVQVLSS